MPTLTQSTLTRPLGRQGLQVSRLCLGTMMFGDQTDSAAAADMLALARERGINFVDTADVYSKGASEAMLGPLISKDRSRWVLASKVGNAMGSGPNESGYSRTWVLRALEDSLKRLNTDYLDIYYLHRDFERLRGGVNLEEIVLLMGDLIRSGKIRAFAVSNFRAWRIAEIVALCKALHVPQPIACQPYYNALNRMPEVEVLPACDHFRLGVVSYSPIARGVLSGKYAPGATKQVAPAETRAARGDSRIMQTEFREESLQIAQEVSEHAKARGLTAAQWATAWVLANQIVTSVIAGPRTAAQWADYFPALEYQWTAEDEAFIDTRVRPGHPSTHGYSDPSYPFFGRRVGKSPG